MSTEKENLIAYDELKEQLKWIEPENLSNMSDEELKLKYKAAYDLYNFYFILQNVTKTLCNSVYGGFGTPSLRYYNSDVAKDITGEARYACQMMEKTGQKYFEQLWHNDVEWHNELKEKFPHIFKSDTVVKKIEKDIIITCDTDSVSADSYIDFIDDHNEVESQTIEWFVSNECLYNYTSSNGTEYFTTNRKISNWSYSNGLYWDVPLQVCRHKVSKEKWKMVLENNTFVDTTSDHSMIVFREINGFSELQKISVKPNEVRSGDMAMYWNGGLEEPEFLKIISCKYIGKYNDEWVYDVSMPNHYFREIINGEIITETSTVEDCQTFFANGILVHNSNYITFDYVFESLGLDPYNINSKEAVDFIVYFMKTKMDPIYNKVLDKIIGIRNGVNYMEFELEAVGGFGIFLAKKKYAYATLWQDGKYIADQKKLKVTGIELKQKAAPKEIKDVMKAFVNTIFVKKGQISSELFFGLCKSVKDRLKTYDIPALSKSTKLNKYDDYVIEDKDRVQLRPKTPVGVRGSANYNHIIQKNNLQSEYPLLKNGMLIKIYYDVNGQPFAYPIEYGYPKDHVPKMSADTQIEKMLFTPIKRLVTGLIDGDVKQMGSDKMQQGLSAIFNKYKK